MYTVSRIPILAHGSPGVYTILEDDTVAIAILKDSPIHIRFSDAKDLPESADYDITHRNTFLTVNDSKSCIGAIVHNNKTAIPKRCVYHLVKDSVPPTVTRLAPNIILLTNLSEHLELRCYDHATVNTSTNTLVLMDPQVAHQITCACDLVLKDTGEFIPKLFQNCHNNETTPKYLFILNLVYLQKFFSEMDLHFLEPDTWLDKNISISLPTLLIEDSEANKSIVVEKALRHNLQKILNTSRDDLKVYSKFSDYVFDEMSRMFVNQDTSFSWFNWMDWLSLENLTLSLLSRIGVIYPSFKLKALAAILVG